MAHHFGYGIVDAQGKPWWSEDCVCQDRAPLEEIVDGLNDEDFTGNDAERQPYRVVELFFQGVA